MARSESDALRVEADIELVGDALDAAIRELSGPRTLELLDELRRAAIAMRAGSGETRARFSQRFARLDDDSLGEIVRAVTAWFHLVNAAEEVQRVRLLRRYDPAHPARYSLAHALDVLASAGLDARQVRGQISQLFVMPVLTAHPTEARRRTLRDHVSEIAQRLEQLERRPGPRESEQLLRSLAERILVLYRTEESRATKPSPRDELAAGLDVFERTLFDATPAVYRELETALARRFPAEDWVGLAAADPADWVVPCFLRWGSWIGGDRDGNPFVNAHVTRTALERHRALALGRHLQDVDALGRALSVSSRRAPHPERIADLVESLERDRERFPEVAARVRRFTSFEPWREKLWYMAARLRATLAREEAAYVDTAGYQRDLWMLERSLVHAGYGQLALGLLRDCRRRADVFGFHLASLDLRQHSGLHEQAVSELLERSGACAAGSYARMAEPEKRRLLGELLGRAESLAPASRTSLSPGTQDLLATFDMVGRARREQGPRACERYVVSFTSELSDLLEVLFLQRAAGLAAGELRPVPLLEQLEDLDHARGLAESMLASPHVRASLGSELEVMIGYSDSAKQAGYVTSQVALRRAQHALADVAQQTRMQLTIFHGRGGAIGRGGGSSHDAIRAQPERALRGRLRVTEQGETISTRYGSLEVAVRDLEQSISAVLFSGLAERTPVPPEELAERDAIFDEAGRHALAAYRGLLADPERLARYAQAATPINEVTLLPIGSRPSSRRPGFALADLRAIPWVFSWNQSRHGLPGWFGLGSALAGLIAAHGLERVRELQRVSPFFRALIDNAQIALSRADIAVAECYSELADEDARALFPPIAEEWQRTVTNVLAVADQNEVLGHRPHILATVRRRNPHVDLLSHAQIELLKRLAQPGGENERERRASALFTTINGIAAALQTAG